jgi:hypothetical protein
MSLKNFRLYVDIYFTKLAGSHSEGIGLFLGGRGRDPFTKLLI